MSNAGNGYWVIPMRAKNCNKTGFINPNGLWVYLKMGQGLQDAAQSFSQFTDNVFEPLPKTQNTPQEPTLIDVRTERFVWDVHG